MTFPGLLWRLLFFAMALAVMVLAVTACATKPADPWPEPLVITKTVDRPVQVKCPDQRPTKPEYPDTDDKLAMIEEGDIFGLAQAYRAARGLRIQREAENEAQISACVMGE